MSNMSVTRRKKVKGMTLLEVIIVLGIMGVIAAGVVILAQRAIDSQNITKLSQSLNTIQTAMVQSFRGKTSYPESTTPEQAELLRTALISMGRVTAGDFVNPFSGQNLLIYSTAANGVPHKAFGILVAELTQEQCRAVITGSLDLFSYVQVETSPSNIGADVNVNATAANVTGVIKSPSGGGVQFDVTNLTHITSLCGGDAGAGANYDIYFGSR